MQEISESVGGELSETWVGCSKENYSNRPWVNDGGGSGTSCG